MKVYCTMHLVTPEWYASTASLSCSLRANIPETPVVLLINEQGEKEKG